MLAEALVRSHVEALKRRMPHPQAAVLGCTHYPLMEKVFAEALGAGVKVYSQANLVAESLADYLTRRPEFLGTGEDVEIPHHRRSCVGIQQGDTVPAPQHHVRSCLISRECAGAEMPLAAPGTSFRTKSTSSSARTKYQCIGPARPSARFFA